MSGGVRYAPSPTGRLHVGNFRTAWIARAWARALKVPFVMRFEDIDGPRVQAGALEQQLADFEILGLSPDAYTLQSRQRLRHWEAFAQALKARQIYPCFCSRSRVQADLEGIASAPHGRIPLYSGACRNLERAPAVHDLPSVAWRLRADEKDGSMDIVIARTKGAEPDEKSFQPSYQWACAIDDLDGAFDLLVRAWDLESSTLHQRRIQALFSKAGPPAVFQTTLVTHDDGARLEKRSRGVTLDELEGRGWAAERLCRAFEASFQLDLKAFAPSKVFGEARQKMSLADLGLT